jgi:hypothetical protein
VIKRGIGRIFAVFFSSLLALAAGMITVILVGGRWAASVNSPEARGGEALDVMLDLLGPAPFALTVAPALMLLPPVLVVVVGEVVRIRSALYYIAASGAAAAAMLVIAAPYQDGAPLLPHSLYLTVLATGGFAAGGVYWAFAGRNA